MLTELLERTVIQMCKDDSIPYLTSQDGQVVLSVKITDDVVLFAIQDRKIADRKVGLLLISALGSVRFPKRHAARAMTMCNRLNFIGPGRFTIDEDGYVKFWLDFAANETAGPSEFRLVFKLAIAAIERHYGVVMKTLTDVNRT